MHQHFPIKIKIMNTVESIQSLTIHLQIYEKNLLSKHILLFYKVDENVTNIEKCNYLDASVFHSNSCEYFFSKFD